MQHSTLLKTSIIAFFIFTAFSLWADTYSYTFDAQVYTAYDTKNLGGVNWTVTASGHTTLELGFDAAGSKGQRFGLSTIPTSVPSSITMSTTEIGGTINSILVRTAGSAPLEATVSVSVGGVVFTVDGNPSMPVLGDPKAPYYTFVGSGSGEVVISWAQPTTTKALFLKTITITKAVVSGVETIDGQLSVTALNRTINVDANDGETIEIFNAVGKRVIAKTAISGKNTITVEQHGMYIVKVGNQHGKVIL